MSTPEPSPFPWRVESYDDEGPAKGWRVEIVDALGNPIATTSSKSQTREQNEANADAIVTGMNKFDKTLGSLGVAGDVGVEIFTALKEQDKARIANWFEQVAPMFEEMIEKMRAAGVKHSQPFTLKDVRDEYRP